MKEAASNPDRKAIWYVEAEEPNAWLAVSDDVGADIDLRKVANRFGFGAGPWSNA